MVNGNAEKHHATDEGPSASQVPENKLRHNFRLGDITWVKLNGSSWWPAQVIDESCVGSKPKKEDKHDCLVRLYGTCQYLYVDPWKSNSEFEMMLKRENKSAMEAFREVLEKELSRDNSPSNYDEEAINSKDFSWLTSWHELAMACGTAEADLSSRHYQKIAHEYLKYARKSARTHQQNEQYKSGLKKNKKEHAKNDAAIFYKVAGLKNKKERAKNEAAIFYNVAGLKKNKKKRAKNEAAILYNVAGLKKNKKERAKSDFNEAADIEAAKVLMKLRMKHCSSGRPPSNHYA